jgi:hypothetical protein
MNTSLVYPMFAMVLLTAVVLVALFRSRTAAVRAGLVSTAYYRVYQGEPEPPSTAKLSRHLANIFEAPNLFYIVCLAAMVVGQNGLAFVALAWLYVILRAVHAYIHTGSNRLKHRIPAYFSGWIVLMAMWLYLTVGMALR